MAGPCAWRELADAPGAEAPPEREREYLLYQTLVGAWPLDARPRLVPSSTRLREAKPKLVGKTRTRYEAAVKTFVEALSRRRFSPNSAHPLVEPGRRQRDWPRRLRSSRAPGVPDLYQGTELWDLSLVDPDNRRPVDFESDGGCLAGRVRERPKLVLIANGFSASLPPPVGGPYEAARRPRVDCVSRSLARLSTPSSWWPRFGAAGVCPRSRPDRWLGRRDPAAPVSTAAAAPSRTRLQPVAVLRPGAVTLFSVWAPDASRVDVVVEGRTGADASRRRGWAVGCFGLSRGVRYGSPSTAVPRVPIRGRRRSPTSVHVALRLSSTSDEVRVDGRIAGAVRSGPRGAVLYEIHVGTFTPKGTFDAAIARLLVNLADLGVDVCGAHARRRVSPVARGWGYDGVGLYAPHHVVRRAPTTMKRFVQPRTTRSTSVSWSTSCTTTSALGELPARSSVPTSPSATTTKLGRGSSNFDGPWSDEVRRYVVDNALMWLRDYHADGLRLDAVHANPRRVGERHVLEQLAE